MSAAIQVGDVSLKKRALRQKLLNVALTSREFRDTLDEAAAEIRSIAKPDATEATIEGVFESVLYAQLREIGLKFHPKKQQSVELRRHVTWGRMDSRIGALVIEYKRPSLLKSKKEIERALSQLKGYIIALSERRDTPFVGLLTDGLVAIEIRAHAGIIVSESAVEQVSGITLLRITQQFISLALVALTPANLIRDFCGSESNGAVFQTARVLNSVLANGLQRKTEMLFREWEEMFRLAHNDQSQQRRIKERRTALAAIFVTDIEDAESEYRSLFSLHTAYAIVLKLLAYRTVSDIHLGQPNQDYRSLSTSSNLALRSFCDELEEGEVFRLLGIINLLEGDFFLGIVTGNNGHQRWRTPLEPYWVSWRDTRKLVAYLIRGGHLTYFVICIRRQSHVLYGAASENFTRRTGSRIMFWKRRVRWTNGEQLTRVVVREHSSFPPLQKFVVSARREVSRTAKHCDTSCHVLWRSISIRLACLLPA